MKMINCQRGMFAASLALLFLLVMALTVAAEEVKATKAGTVFRELAGIIRGQSPFLMIDDLKSAPAVYYDWVSVKAELDIGRTEATVAEWRECAAAGICTVHEVKDSEYCNHPHEDRAQHPMNCISFAGAEQFCSWAGGRVCTNEEWLKACGTQDYPYGPTYVEGRCNIRTPEDAKGIERPVTVEVGSFPECRNALGVVDMAGNVWEWVESGKDDYAKFRGGEAVVRDPERYGSCKNVCSGNKKASKLLSVGVRCCRGPVPEEVVGNYCAECQK